MAYYILMYSVLQYKIKKFTIRQVLRSWCAVGPQEFLKIQGVHIDWHSTKEKLFQGTLSINHQLFQGTFYDRIQLFLYCVPLCQVTSTAFETPAAAYRRSGQTLWQTFPGFRSPPTWDVQWPDRFLSPHISAVCYLKYPYLPLVCQNHSDIVCPG